jgi:hypothetical protein
MGLAQGMFWNEEKCIFGAALHALGVTFTEITLEGSIQITMKENSPKRARHHTLLARNAFFLINLAVPLFNNDRIGGAVFSALRLFTLLTDNGHSDDRMGINNHHTDATLFRIVNSKTIDGTDHFTKLAARAPLWNNR